MSKPRSVSFTLNNYTTAEVDHIKNGTFKFIIFQEETGAGGTPHLQGYAQLQSCTVFSTWKRLLGERAHIEASKGNADSNIAYCTKLSDRIPNTVVFERGDRPKQGERNDLTKIVNAAMDPTVPIADIIALDPCNFLRFHKGVMAIKSILSPKRNFKTEVFWFYGGTGTGKSTKARELAGPDSYWKQNSPWWCGYDPIVDQTVVIDEYRCDFSKFSFLLQLFDCYPLQVQVKGAQLQFSARRIIVTSPKAPAETWSTRTTEDVQQLLRRIAVVCEFCPGYITRFTKGTPDMLTPLEPIGLIEPSSVVPSSQGEERRVRPRTGSELELSQTNFLNVFDDLNEGFLPSFTN